MSKKKEIKMTFEKILERLLKKPNLQFDSDEAKSYNQDLNSLKFWFYNDLHVFDQMVIADDWILSEEIL